MNKAKIRNGLTYRIKSANKSSRQICPPYWLDFLFAHLSKETGKSFSGLFCEAAQLGLNRIFSRFDVAMPKVDKNLDAKGYLEITENV